MSRSEDPNSGGLGQAGAQAGDQKSALGEIFVTRAKVGKPVKFIV
jgi:hypothetical protein